MSAVSGERRAEIAAALVAAARHLSALGLSPGSSGNLSARVDDSVLITPTGSSFARVQPDDLAIVTLSGEIISGRPSKEFPLHLAAYRVRADAAAVVHLHSPAATAVSCIDPEGEFPLAPVTPYHAMRLWDVPLLAYAAPGSADLAGGVEAAAGRSAALLLGNHGSVTIGATLDSAVDLAEELEAASALQLALGGRRVRPLPPGEAERLAAATSH
jgi:ribulose-5-phosphate 4-epimerase/fuculose-1-phosphate aldolase